VILQGVINKSNHPVQTTFLLVTPINRDNKNKYGKTLVKRNKQKKLPEKKTERRRRESRSIRWTRTSDIFRNFLGPVRAVAGI
jgi:hypothetical protein